MNDSTAQKKSSHGDPSCQPSVVEISDDDVVTRRTPMVASLVMKLRPLRLSSVKLSLSLIEHLLIISQSV